MNGRGSSRLAAENGFTMIELILAIFISLIVIGALSALFITSNDSSFSNQRELDEVAVLQQQIEQIHHKVAQYGFSALALTSAPAGPTDSPLPPDPTDPNDFVNGSACGKTFTVQSNYNRTTESYPTSTVIGDNPEPVLVNGCTVSGNSISGGQLTPVQYKDLSTGAISTSAPSGDPYATIYTFVTQTTAVGCNTSLTSGSGNCTGDARRVIAAVVFNAAPSDVGPNYPTYATTVFANPVPSNQPTSASGLRILGLIP